MSPDEPSKYARLFAAIAAGNEDAFITMKRDACTNPSAAYFVAVTYAKGCYKGVVDPQLSLVYYCIASYLSSPGAKDYLKKHQSSAAEACLSYLRSHRPDSIDIDHMLMIVNDPNNEVMSMKESNSSVESKSDQHKGGETNSNHHDEQRNVDDSVFQVRHEMSDAEYHKSRRDEFNGKVKEWKQKRNNLNNEVKITNEQIPELLKQRDALNDQVKRIKAERDQLQTIENQVRQELRKTSDADSQRVTELRMRLQVRRQLTEQKHQEMVRSSKDSQAIQQKIDTLFKTRADLQKQADDAHKQFIKYKREADQEHELYLRALRETKNTPPGRVLKQDSPDAVNVIFMDFSHYLNEVKYHDPAFGSSLREQFKTISVKTPFDDVTDLFKTILLKESQILHISTPNYERKWVKDKKYAQFQYLKNIAIRVDYNETHDLVLVADLVKNEGHAESYRFIVKGFVFVDVNVVHSTEIDVSGRIYVRMDQKNASWLCCSGLVSASNVNNQINSRVIDFLENNSVIRDLDCVEYMGHWKRYLDSRTYVLRKNERQKLGITSVNLQIATFCDDCTDEMRSQYESIPYIIIPREKRQGWFIDQIDEDHCRRVLLLHVSKEYGNSEYRKYKGKTDISFKKEFEQFTRDGLKLYGGGASPDEDRLSREDGEEENVGNRDYEDSVIDTYDSRVSNTFVEEITPDQEIKSLEAEYSERYKQREQELAKKRDDSIDQNQLNYRAIRLHSDLKDYEDNLIVSAADLKFYADQKKVTLTAVNREELEEQLRKELISKEMKRLIESNYVLLKNKFDIQYTNALSDFNQSESERFEEEKKIILRDKTTLCLHVYYDLSEEINVNDEGQISSLNDRIANLRDPYIRRNLDGDRVLLTRQSEGIENLLKGFVKNPYLTTFLFKPQYRASSEIKSGDETEFFQNLNRSQKDAVVKAISSNGLYLIQGPPGTGKTQTIAEITTQLVKSGKKVLIASQNNKAVDTAFGRLPDMPYIRPVRVLRDNNNLYSYDNLTSNLYKNIVGSLKRQIKKHNDEHKYVDEAKLLIENLTGMKDSIERIESQLGDLERDIESHENDLARYRGELSRIHQEFIDGQQEEELHSNLSMAISEGEYDSYISLIKKWPEGLSSMSDEQKEMFLRTLVTIDEDYFMDALADPDSIDDTVPDDDSSDTNNISKMSIRELVSFINNGYGDLIEAFEVYQTLVEEIHKKSEGESKKAKLIAKSNNKHRRDESSISDQIATEEKYIQSLKEDMHYQTLLRERSDFNREVSKCFSELEIEAELDQESAIDIIKRTISDVKRKLNDRRSNLEGRIAAYQMIVNYLSDGDVLRADKSRINDAILRYVNVIGITCSKAWPGLSIKDSKDQNLKLNSLNIDVVILDETSKIPFSELVPPILYGKTVILVGDHRQLPPVYSEIKREDFDLYDSSKVNQDDERLYKEVYTDSFFGKLFQKTPNDCKSTLTIQYRMHPQIMDLVNTFYPDTPLEYGGGPYDKEHYIVINGAYSQILNPEKHILFINCDGREKRESGTTSSYNSKEAETVVRLLDLLNDNCHSDRDGNPVIERTADEDKRLSLGVICPYKGQVNRIRDMKKASYRSFNGSPEEKVTISTVDNFQGDERDIIILSMVRTEQCEWLSEYRRINVAMSRARRLLIIVGNERGLSNIDVTIETSNGPIIKKAYREIIGKISEAGCRLEYTELIRGVL